MHNDKENFNQISKDYDNSMRTNRAKIIADEIRSHIIGGCGKTAIEFGCGTGLVGLQLASEFLSLLLTDYSEGMLEQVKQKITETRAENVSTLCCDFTKGIPDGLCADYIFSSLALHHIIDTEAILRCFYKILNPGGRLLVVDIDKGGDNFHAKYPDFNGYDGFEHSELEKIAEQAGFSKSSVKTFYHGSKIANGNEISYSLFILDAEK